METNYRLKLMIHMQIRLDIDYLKVIVIVFKYALESQIMVTYLLDLINIFTAIVKLHYSFWTHYRIYFSTPQDLSMIRYKAYFENVEMSGAFIWL